MNENEQINETEIVVELTAGQMLCEARTTGRRKRELSTVAKQLCIREEYLAALEAGDYETLKEHIYALGFARNYAIELGLDPDVIVGKIKQELGLCENEPAGTFFEKKDKKNGKFKSLVVKTGKGISKNWKIFALVAALIIAGAIVALSLGRGKTEVAPEQPVVQVAEPLVVSPDYKQPVRETFGNENKATAKTILQANSESWVKVEDARGETLFSRVLVSGDVYYVPDAKGLKGTFGNAGGIDIWQDGVLQPAAGPAHERKTGIAL